MKKIPPKPFMIMVVAAAVVTLGYFSLRIMTTKSGEAEAVVPQAGAPNDDSWAVDVDTDTEKPEQEKKGKDFSMLIFKNGNETIRYLEVLFKGNDEVENYVDTTDFARPLNQMVFGQNDVFELVQVIPTEPREQIVVNQSMPLSDGLGALQMVSILRVAPSALTEVFSAVTERENGPKNFKFKASYTIEKTNPQKPVLVYKYDGGGSEQGTVLCTWDGHQFADPTGKILELKTKYMP